MTNQETGSRSNIILVGMMGVGKTAVGRMLARELNYDFVDTDTELEKVTGLKVMEVYQKYGKIRFNSEESLLLNKLLNADNTVISTGGTMALMAENAQRLSGLGFVVWLKASPQTIYNRTRRKNHQPLLPKGATLATVEELVESSAHTYEQLANFEIWADQMDLESVVARIKNQYLDLRVKI